MILEKAIVQYNKSGEYQYTIHSDYMQFSNREEIDKYIQRNLQKDIEYYIYEDEKHLENNDCKEVIICNQLR